MKAYELEMDVFYECVQSHPRFNELYHALPLIFKFLIPVLEPHEKKFQEYLDGLKRSNFLAWMYANYGNKRKFDIHPRFLKKHKAFDFVKWNRFSIPYFAAVIPYLFYFPTVIENVQKQPGHVFRNGEWFNLNLYRANQLVYPLISFIICIRVDFRLVNDRISSYLHELTNGEVKYYRDDSQIKRQFKRLFETYVFKFQTCLEFEFFLRNVPNRDLYPPDFKLSFFNKHNLEPVFSVIP